MLSFVCFVLFFFLGGGGGEICLGKSDILPDKPFKTVCHMWFSYLFRRPYQEIGDK